MSAAQGVLAALRLARPAQWPVLTGQLVVGMLLAAPRPGPGAGDWWAGRDPVTLLAAWLAWVVLLNGGTLAFNSAYDRDTGPVAYLARPPRPPRRLAPAALIAMAAGVLVAVALVGTFFAGVVATCVVLSVLYSHPAVRLKSRPGWDLAVNVVGYGLGTTLAGLAAAAGRAPGPAGWSLAAGFGLLFGSFYPLTQLYQAADDRARGDRTVTTALGVAGALRLALGLGVLAAAALLGGLHLGGRTAWWPVPLVALLLWLGHIRGWLRARSRLDDRAHERGMYRALVLWAVVDAAVAAAWLRG